ncbi:tetratricopeptide repeat protein [Pseudoalteromonas sp. SSDWG2]|uniref:tetratricopeptide repeat protein n=1 Tax=Pseudoalteromonas sp. SSDWG2 TaxID=3139391 RepID=UPI003BAC1598
MSVLNKTLKAIEQRQSDSQLGLEPTVALPRKNVNMSRLLILLGCIIGLILIALAYRFIPTKTVEHPGESIITEQPLVTESSTVATNEANAQPDPNEPERAKQQKMAAITPMAANEVAQNNGSEIVRTHGTATERPLAGLNGDANAADLSAEILVIPASRSAPVHESDSGKNIQQKQSVISSFSSVPSEQISVANAAPEPEPAKVVVKALSPTQQAMHWFEKGQQSLNYGMSSEAIAQFEQALSLDPEHEQARTLLGATLYAQQRVEEAYQWFAQGLQRKPEQMQWRVLIAKMATQEQRFSRVLAVLGEQYDVLAKQLADNDYWILKGTAATQLQQHDVAKNCFYELAQRQPHVGKWWLALASAEEAMGERAQAFSHYRKALDVGGLSPQSQQFAQARYQNLQGAQ